MTALKLSVGFLLVVSVGCAKNQQKPQRQSASVSVASARRATVPYNIDANGIVMPIQTSAVAAQVDGILLDVDFQEGQEVTRGQVLFHIDPRPYQNAYRQAQGVLARDKATAENAQHEVDRYTKLVEKEYVTKEQADQQRATAASAWAVLQADSANVATARFNLDNCVIRAPISGKTGSLLVRPGNLVRAAGGVPLVVINQIKPILVRFAVPASQLPLILQYGAKGGLPVTAVPGGALPSTGPDSALGPKLSMDASAPATDGTGGAASDGAGNAAAAGRSADPATQQGALSRSGASLELGALSFIDNAVDTTTATVTLKGTFPNRAGQLWVGQFASTTLKLFDETNALVVPSQSVVTGQRGTYVYTVDATDTARQRPVVVERIVGEITILASGITDGDRVVTDGQSRLTPGTPVTIRTPTGAPVGDASAANSGARGGRGRGRGGNGSGGGGGRRAGGNAAVGDGGGRPQ